MTTRTALDAGTAFLAPSPPRPRLDRAVAEQAERAVRAERPNRDECATFAPAVPIVSRTPPPPRLSAGPRAGLTGIRTCPSGVVHRRPDACWSAGAWRCCVPAHHVLQFGARASLFREQAEVFWMSHDDPHPSIYKSASGYAEVVAAYDRVLELWPTPRNSLTVATRWGRTHVLAWGPQDGPPLVLLHGGGNCAAMWIYTAAGLGQRFRLYAPDIVGDMGRSEPSRQMTSSSDYVEWLADTFDGLGLTRVPVAGISWGGGLALASALGIAERVSHVVALCPAWGLAMFRIAALVFRSLPAALFPNPRRVRRLLQWLSAKNPAFADPFGERIVDYLVAALRHYRRPKPVRPVVFGDGDLQNLRAPVLLMIGDREVIYSDPHAVARRASRLIPSVRVETVPGAGHALISDQPELVIARIVEFLA